MTIEEKQEQLIEDILYLMGSYTYSPTWNDNIQGLNFGIEVVDDTLEELNHSMVDESQMDTHKIYVTKVLIEELLHVAGKTELPDSNHRYKARKVYKLSCLLRKKLESFPNIVVEEEKPISLDGLVKSLQIYKLQSKKISEEFYETGQDVFYSMRKIILQKDPSFYQRFYVGKVAKILKDGNEEGQNFLSEDFELEKLVGFITNSPEFYVRRRNDWNIQKAIINERIEKGFYESDLKVLIKSKERLIKRPCQSNLEGLVKK